MARTLSPSQLALEAATDEAYVSSLVELGLLKPSSEAFTPTDIYRVRTVQALEEAGLSLERIAPMFSEGQLSLDFLDYMLPPPAPLTGRTFAEFSASFGPRADSVGLVYEMLGLARPPDMTPTREDEEHVVGEIVSLWGDDPELMKRAARIAGFSIRLIVEGWTGLHYEFFRRLGGGDRRRWSSELLARETATAGRSIALAEEIPAWLTHRHYEQVLYADIIENIEMQIGPFDERRIDIAGVTVPAIVFIDLSGFTAMTDAMGDAAASTTTAHFEEVVSLQSLRHGGRVVKMLGDGALLYFSAAAAAVQATVKISEGLSDSKLRPHAGIDCGPVAERDGDVFGRTVNMASRLASAATEGQVLVSTSVAEAARSAGFTTIDVGELDLKGVDRPVPGFVVAT